MGADEEIRKIEEELERTQYNKATQGHVGRLKAKLARLREEAAKPSGGGAGLGYALKKLGDATVILVGFPSVGKSTLLNCLTNAASPVAEYEFTTLTVVPGMLDYLGARIQVLDIPGIIEQAAAGRGRGREVLSVMRAADLLLIVVAGEGWKRQRGVIESELHGAGFRLNQRPPDVKIVKRSGGGIRVQSPRRWSVDPAAAREAVREFGIMNADVAIRQAISLEQLVDCLAGNRKYVPALFLLNKADAFDANDGSLVRISALRKEGIDQVKQLIWERLGLKRVYLKKPGKEPDLQQPLIMRGEVQVRDVCMRLRFLKHAAAARIWGPSSRFPGQQVGLGHHLRDGDIVELHV